MGFLVVQAVRGAIKLMSIGKQFEEGNAGDTRQEVSKNSR
jgi:hypothetical protein